MPLNAVFRCDASPEMGIGHLMRCICLADCFAVKGYNIRFIINQGAEKMIAFPYKTIADEPVKTDILVVDHYGLDEAYESQWREHAATIIVIDDLISRKHNCDVLIDQTFGRRAGDYEGYVTKDTLVLAGSDYALLRPAFAAHRPAALTRRTNVERVEHLYISFGSTNPDRIVQRVLENIAGFNEWKLDIHIVMGKNAQQPEEVEKLAAASPHKVHFHLNADAAYVATLMSQADFAIGAGGTTSWERCCLGLPALLYAIADNQKDTIAALSRGGAIIDGGTSKDFDKIDFALFKSAHKDMAQRAAHAVDGKGVNRILETLAATAKTKGGKKVHLRAMTLNDEAMMFCWQNQPDIRKYARNPSPPTPEEHHRWMIAKLSDPECHPYIIHAGGQPVGHLRFDRIPNSGEDDYEVSILLDSKMQGSGIAAAALRASEKIMPHAAIHAEVLPANDTSSHLFSAAGFKKSEGNWYVKRYR